MWLLLLRLLPLSAEELTLGVCALKPAEDPLPITPCCLSSPPSPLHTPSARLQVQGSQAKVHWWYLPDSYDEWVPAAATPGTAEAPRRPPRGPWHVYARWLTDSEKYNE